MNKTFETVVIGGTFDVLHKGHQKLIMKAFEVSNFVHIGLTSDAFLKKLRKPHGIASYSKRLDNLKNLIKQNGLLERTKITRLEDSFGVTLSENQVDAIVVSDETEPRAKQINEKRKDLGLSPLRIVTVKMALSEDHYPISSTRIWFEEIDKNGNLL
jgi:pantetheine-phosphate adenylyltransferase